jgi:hypothetical protein
LYGLYVQEEPRETLRYRLNISPAKCNTTAVLYVEDDSLLGFDTVWPDTKPRGITSHFCPDGGGCRFLRNCGTYLPNCMKSF